MLDKFGITRLNRTASEGRKWYSNWDKGQPRIWSSEGIDKRNADPMDPEMDLHCKTKERNIVTTAAVDGKGICTLTGTTPRLYINDPKRVKKWLNVEMTVYFYVVKKLPKGSAYVACRLAGRSNHQNEYNCSSSGTGYSFEAKSSNGYNQLKKELSHPAYADNVISKVQGVESGTWYGHKLIVKTQPNGAVLVQGYRDITDGKDGGEWKLLVEKMDNGDWRMSDPKDLAAFEKAKSCNEFPKVASPTAILSDPAISCYLRCDNVQARFKRDSVSEKLASEALSGLFHNFLNINLEGSIIL